LGESAFAPGRCLGDNGRLVIGLREALAALVALSFGCYSPSFQEGVPCGEGGTCPTGQVCNNGECRSPSKIPDASDVDCPNPTALMFTPSNFDVCDIPADPQALDITTTTTIDTDAGTIAGSSWGSFVAQDGGPEVMLVAVRSFTLAEAQFLDVVGARPLVIVSLQDMTIDGVMLASGNLSDLGASVANGPGVDLTLCGAGVGTDGVIDGGAYSGAGGGGFGASGGLGAGLPTPVAPIGTTSPKPSSDPFVNVAGGGENGTATIVPLRGGCPGGLGGGPRGGAAGGGGGALQLVAAGNLSVGAMGIINVAGGGGRGGGGQGAGMISASGGGGGGSGGAVLLEAGLTINLAAGSVITAAGGGGGGGAYAESAGMDGGNGGTAGPGAGGTGGISAAENGGAGGAGGGVDPDLVGVDGGSGTLGGAAGGGGGGGGTGRIVARSPANTFGGQTFPNAIDSAL